MRALRTGTATWLLGSALLFSCQAFVNGAQAADAGADGALKQTGSIQADPIAARMTPPSNAHISQTMRFTARRGLLRPYAISCVPYARQVSGIQVVGNAWAWWNKAAGMYARGSVPEAGSVLNFRANGRMRLGHVAVVTRVVNPREVIVDHANWPSGVSRGGVSRDVAVVDVSEANNWSAVRVELGRDGTFGSVYPTYGFIYNRPDTGTVLASVVRPAPQAVINPILSDLRPAAERPWRTMEEVAESPSRPRKIDLIVQPVGSP